MAGSIIAGWIGTTRRIGGFGAFFLALLLSPFIGILAALLSRHNEDIARDKELLALQRKQFEVQQPLSQPTTGINEAGLPKDPVVRAARLRQLLESGVVNEEQYRRLLP